ncbi:MAG: SinR family protein [Deltaproteobacteria bacterium]|nr:SinR family protein [Deltaproteobacteria bacterium]
MSVHSISYDLRQPGQDYGQLIEQLKSLGGWCRPTASQWLVDTQLTIGQVQDRLLPFIDANDKLLISEVTGAMAWHGLAPEVVQWIRSRFGRGAAARRY